MSLRGRGGACCRGQPHPTPQSRSAYRTGQGGVLAVSAGKHARGGGGYLSPQIAMIAVRKGGRGKLGSNRVALMGEPSAIAAERFPHGFSGGSFTPETGKCAPVGNERSTKNDLSVKN